MRRSLSILAFSLAAFGKLSACAQDGHLGTPTPAITETTHEVVYYFGDSLGAMSRGPCAPDNPNPCTSLRDIWPTHPEYSVSTENIQGGTFLQDWHLAMNNLPAATTVVLELGTNNLLNEAWNTGETRQNMIDTLNIMRSRGVTRVVWPTINEYVGHLRGGNYEFRPMWMNQWMRDLVASGEYADIGLEIADWNAIASPLGHTIISDDNLHHNVDGNNLFAEFMVEAVLPDTAE